MNNDAYIINDLESLSKNIRKNVSLTFTQSNQDNLDEYITIKQIIELIYQHSDITNNGSVILDEIGYDNIFEAVRIRIYNAGLSKLAANGYVECAWDDDSNTMVFWSKNGVSNKG